MAHAVFTVLIDKALTVAKRAERPGERSRCRPSRGRSGPACGGATPTRTAVTVAGVGALAVALAGCGGGSHPSTATAPSTAPSTTAVPATTATTLSAQAAAVLAAYRAEQAAFETAEHTADPSLPALAATMTGAQLQSVRRFLLADQAQGIIGRGPVTLHPHVASINGNQAVVLDCAYDASELIYAKTGKPVPPITPPEHVGIRSTLAQVSPGIWKVAQQHVTEGSCPPGY